MTEYQFRCGEIVTRRDLLRILAESGVDPDGPAAAALARDTAPHRHAWRVAQTRQAAWAAASAALECGGGWQYTTLCAAGIIAADMVGVGGPTDSEGLSTDRLPCLALGAGRKQAADGGAWMSAAEVAMQQLLADIECSYLAWGVIDPSGESPTLAVAACRSIARSYADPARRRDVTPHGDDPFPTGWIAVGDLRLPDRWTLAILRRGMRAAAGLAPPQLLDGDRATPVFFALGGHCSLECWCAAYDAHVGRLADWPDRQLRGNAGQVAYLRARAAQQPAEAM